MIAYIYQLISTRNYLPTERIDFVKSIDTIVTLKFNKDDKFCRDELLSKLQNKEVFDIVSPLKYIIEGGKLPKPDSKKEIKPFKFVKNNFGDIYVSAKKNDVMSLTDNNLLRLYEIYKMRKNMSPDELKNYAILDFDNYEYLICSAYYRLHRRKLPEILDFADTAKELDKLLFVRALKKQP